MSEMAMEGTLWKWTNYFSGWQPRWFVLDNGVLSYYKSQDDVVNGCKGSVNMSVCDVTVHSGDKTRLDLAIPGEAHFYVKAATALERQQWLLALGSCKAGLVNSTVTARGPLQSVTEWDTHQEETRAKKSELKIYCDLLMQQVQQVKSSVPADDSPDLEQLNNATSLLRATCDTFLCTLDECMLLSNRGSTPPSPVRKPLNVKTSSPASFSRQNSVDSYRRRSHIQGFISPGTGSRSARSSVEKLSPRLRTASEGTLESLSQNPPVGPTNNHVANQSEPVEIAVERVPTLFTEMPVSFMDIRLREDGGIPVPVFLDACRAVLVIFDKLNSTAFAPVKMDVVGNIRKIQQKYQQNPSGFETLQNIVLFEVKLFQHTSGTSATVALLWLKRTLVFIRHFLTQILSSTAELNICAQNAYERSLQPHHSWMVRSVFALALKSVPYREEFLSHFSIREDFSKESFQSQLFCDMENYVTALDVVIKILDDFYFAQDLNKDEANNEVQN